MINVSSLSLVFSCARFSMMYVNTLILRFSLSLYVTPDIFTRQIVFILTLFLYIYGVVIYRPKANILTQDS